MKNRKNERREWENLEKESIETTRREKEKKGGIFVFFFYLLLLFFSPLSSGSHESRVLISLSTLDFSSIELIILVIPIISASSSSDSSRFPWRLGFLFSPRLNFNCAWSESNRIPLIGLFWDNDELVSYNCTGFIIRFWFPILQQINFFFFFNLIRRSCINSCENVVVFQFWDSKPCWIVIISLGFLQYWQFNFRELKIRRRLRGIWLQQQLLLKEESKMLVMTHVAFVLKSSARAIHQLYVL